MFQISNFSQIKTNLRNQSQSKISKFQRGNERKETKKKLTILKIAMEKGGDV